MCLKHSFYSPDVTFITNIFGRAALTFMSFVTLKAGEGELNISARIFSLLSSCYPSAKTLPPKTCKHSFCQTGSSLPAQQKYGWFGIRLHADAMLTLHRHHLLSDFLFFNLHKAGRTGFSVCLFFMHAFTETCTHMGGHFSVGRAGVHGQLSRESGSSTVFSRAAMAVYVSLAPSG